MLPRTLFSITAILLALFAGSGCQTAHYYSQAIGGQWQIMSKKQPIPEVIRQELESSRLAQRLKLVQEIVAFAEKDLGLPAEDQYQSYLDLKRPYVVWNVQAAPEFSLEAKTWWYPIVGSLEYRGYFKKQLAVEQGDRLKRDGYDVYVGGVTAYSTLGWFDDPVLNTFIDRGDADADLAELLFHELAHRRLFFSGDTDFNEAFATTVGREGALRWLRANRSAEELVSYLEQSQRDDRVIALILGQRDALERVYERSDEVPPQEMRVRKNNIIAELRSEYQQLKQGWPGYSGFEGFMAAPINNARLNGVDTYFDLVPKFERLLAACGGDLNVFFELVETTERMDKDERRAFLDAAAVAQ